MDYCRTAHDDGFTLHAQIDMLKDFAKRKRLSVAGISAEIESRLNLNREGLNQIKETAKSQKANIILTRDISCIGRNILKVIKFIHSIKSDIEFKTYYEFDM